MRRLALLFSALALAFLLASCHADGLTFTVDSTDDRVDVNPGDGICADSTGSCTLRAAVMEANASAGVDKILLSAGATYTLTIPGTGEDGAATGDLDITEGVEFWGGAATVVDAAGLDRVVDLHLSSSDTVEFFTASLAGGSAADGAAVRLDAGKLSLSKVEVRNATASTGAPVSNAGGTLSASVATFVGNAGITAGAYDQTAGSASFTNTTFSGNTATAGAGALSASAGSVDVELSTVTENSGTTTGGLGQSGTATVTAVGSIVADQSAGTDCAGTVTSGGHNLESATDCGFGATGDLQTADPDLGTLAADGGLVRTHLPAATSPAIDAYPTGAGLCETTTDARSLTRPNAGDCDIGAVEWQGLQLTVTNGLDDVDDNPGDGVCQDTSGAAGECSLRAAVDEANARTDGALVTISPTVKKVTLSRAGSGEDGNATGDLDVANHLVLQAGGATVDADGLDRVLDLSTSGATTRVTLQELSVTGGSAGADGGGVRVGGAVDLTLERSAVVTNSAVNGGGLAIAGGAALSADNSTIGDNTATDTGGAVDSSGSVDLSFSTVTDNDTSTGGALQVSAGDATVTGSIVGDQAAGDDCGGTVTSGGYNIESATTCGFTAGGDLQSTNPTLTTLTDGEFYQPAGGSPAIDLVPSGTAGCGSTVAVDQRDRPRPIDSGCEAGAVELGAIVDAEPFVWTYVPGPEPHYVGTLEYGEASFTMNNGDTLTTRAYRQEGGDYSIPGPTITMEPGNKYVLKFRNLLPYEAPSPNINTLKDPNITNVHTHGLHISPESPSDDVFRMFEGGYGGDYVWDIPADHMGGTHWYHAHHHGSTFLQVASGGFGLIVIDDSADGIPDNVAAMDEREVDLAWLEPNAGTGGDTLISGTLGNTWMANGEVGGSMIVPPNTWEHWRILVADTNSKLRDVSIGTGCETKLLGRDGVWRTTAPADITDNTLSLTGASRADLAVRCTADTDITVGRTVVANVVVRGTSNPDPHPYAADGVSTWSATRPDYLRDLSGETVVHAETVNLGAANVNGIAFDPTTPLFTLNADSVQEWLVQGGKAHPFHLHVYHQQTFGCGGDYEDGEYYDTIGANCTVRFDINTATSSPFAGKTIFHCHILEHEDKGAMGYADVIGGTPPPTYPAGFGYSLYYAYP